MKKSKIIKYLILSGVVFIILFIFRIGYGYTIETNSTTLSENHFSSESSYKRNYASEKYYVKSEGRISSVNVDQKYEKIADINSNSSQFEKNESQTRKSIENLNAIIQFEQKSGNTGQRKLNLLIGVPPENFDAIYEDLIKIGEVNAKQITKKDKTNEYKELHAKKTSLEKMRESLIALKQKGGKIEEFMNLEDRILDIENQLQDLGVSLGDFDDENEFCTVKYALQESYIQEISIYHRLKVSLEWTVKIYLKLFSVLCFISISLFLSLWIFDKLNELKKMLVK